MQFQTAQKCLKAIQQLPGYQHMVLQALNMQEVQHYMQVALDKDTIGEHTATAIHARTGGLPLYVEQVPPPTLPLVYCLPRKAMQGVQIPTSPITAYVHHRQQSGHVSPRGI